MRVTVLVFAVGQHAQKVCTTCVSSDFWERTGTSFKVACLWKGQKALKIRFYRIYIEISQLGRTESQSEIAQV